MGTSIAQARGSRQPKVWTPLDRHNSLTKNLEFVFTPWSSVVGAQPAFASVGGGTPGIASGVDGDGFSFNVTANERLTFLPKYNWATSNVIVPTSGFSIELLVNPLPRSGVQNYGGFYGSGAGQGDAIYIWRDLSYIRLGQNVSTVQFTSTDFSFNGRPEHIVITCPYGSGARDYSIYKNGKFAQTASGTPGTIGAITQFVGSLNALASPVVGSLVYKLAFYTRELTAGEVLQLWLDPYQVFMQQDYDPPYAAAAPAGGFQAAWARNRSGMIGVGRGL